MVTNEELAVLIMNDYRYVYDEISDLEKTLARMLKKRDVLSERLAEIRERERTLIEKIKQDTGQDFNLIEFLRSLQNDQDK